MNDTIKKKRSIWDNYRWVKKRYDELMGKKCHIHTWLFIFLSLIVPFISMTFPSVAVGVMQSDRTPAMMLVIIVVYAIALKAFNVALGYVDNAYAMDMFIGRIYIGADLNSHIPKMDYEKLESIEGQQKQEKAVMGVYRGNDYGVEQFYSRFPRILLNVAGVVIYSLIVVQVSPWILFYMLASAILLSALGMRKELYDNRQIKFRESAHEAVGRVFNETLNRKTRHDIMLYHANDWMKQNMKRVLDDLEKYFKGFFSLSRTSGLCTAILNFIRDAVVYVILISQIAKGQLSVEELLLYMGAIAGYAAWVRELMNAALVIVMQNGIISDYRDFLEFGLTEEKEVTSEFVARQGKIHEIRFDSVSYCYNGNEEMTLKDINLTLHEGEKVALVGENGAGKTTLVKLLTGLYKPTKGRIYMDGMDVTELNKEEYFKEFSVVFQDSIVIASSVAENVACDTDFDEERVIHCLKDAGLYEKVSRMKNGIHTMLTRNLDPEGEDLSGGETQKLMLARALYRNAPVLVLDEPTAALDPLAESRMYETYTSFGKEKTSVFISHRLSSTRFCDRICFLQNGRIVEEGNHRELMEKNGCYANMFNIQAKYYKEQEEQNNETEA